MSEQEPRQRRKSRSSNARSLSPRTSLRRGLSPVITPVAKGLRRLRNLARSQSPRSSRASTRLLSTHSRSSQTLPRPFFGPQPLPLPSLLVADDDDDDEDLSQPLAPPSFARLSEDLRPVPRASGILPDSKPLSRPSRIIGNGKAPSRPSRMLVEMNSKPLPRTSGFSQARPMPSPLDIDEKEEIQWSPSPSPEPVRGVRRKRSSKEKKKSSSESDVVEKPSSCPALLSNSRERALVDEEDIPHRPSSAGSRIRSTRDSRRDKGHRRPSHEKKSTNEPTKPSDKRPSRPTLKFHESMPEPAGHIKPERRRSSSADKRYNNLDKKSLQSVKHLKDSIKEMRNNRHKVKFHESGPLSPIPDGTPGTPASVAPPSAAVMSASTNTFGSSTTSITKDFNNSSLTGFGEITMDDLEVGFFKQASHAAQSQQQQQQQQQQDLQAESLRKQTKKTQKLVKRTSRDVWSEREEITNLQRKNWSIRKTLMQTDAPPDSLTTLNLKIEKLVRQDRELDLENDQIEEEKHQLEQECSQLAKAIGEFKDLFDALNTKIVPLLPKEEDLMSQPSGSDELSDSINSIEGDDDEEEEGSISLSHLRLLSPVV